MTYWTPVTPDSQPPPDPPWAWWRYSADDQQPVVLSTIDCERWDSGLWAPITGPMPPAPDARAPEPEPKFKAGDVVVCVKACVGGPRAGETVTVAEYVATRDETLDTLKPEGYGLNWGAVLFRPATPGEEAAHRYPVGRRVRATTTGEVGKVTGHVDHDEYVLAVDFGGIVRPYRIRDKHVGLLWDLLPEAPERPAPLFADGDRVTHPDYPGTQVIKGKPSRDGGVWRYRFSTIADAGIPWAHEDKLTPCDPPSPPVDPGPWRPTSETPEVGRDIIAIFTIGRPWVTTWRLGDLFSANDDFIGWMYADDALALIDAGHALRVALSAEGADHG